jgi:DNA-binding GntR family transcriptional regulator
MSTDATARKLTNLLMTGAIRPGQFLSIREVSEMVGSPLGNAREAVQQLAQTGFLSIYPNRGVQVTEITPRHVRDAFAYREIIETHAVRAFIKSASEAEIDRLIDAQNAGRELIRSMTDKEQLQAMIGVNEALHKELVNSLENVFVTKYFDITLSHIDWMRVNVKTTGLRHSQVIDEHIAILMACKQRDPDKATALLSDHLNKALHITLYS